MAQNKTILEYTPVEGNEIIAKPGNRRCYFCKNRLTKNGYLKFGSLLKTYGQLDIDWFEVCFHCQNKSIRALKEIKESVSKRKL